MPKSRFHKEKTYHKNEDFTIANTTTFKSRVKDLNKQYIAITSLLAAYYTQISNSSILQTKWNWILSLLNSFSVYSFLKSQFIIVGKEKQIRTKCSLPAGRLKLSGISSIRYRPRAKTLHRKRQLGKSPPSLMQLCYWKRWGYQSLDTCSFFRILK